MAIELSDLDGKTIWRGVIFAIILIGMVYGYIRTGSILQGIGLGILSGFVAGFGIAVIASVGYRIRFWFSGNSSNE